MLPAVIAVEVIRVVGVILEQQRSLVYNCVTLLTDVLAKAPSFLPVVTRTTQVPDGREKEMNRQKSRDFIYNYFRNISYLASL